MRLSTKILFLILVNSISISCENKTAPEELEDRSYTTKWKEFKTTLILSEKSFQPYTELDEQKNDISLVKFISDSMMLKGLLNTANIDTMTKRPALVYLHGGFALGYSTMEQTKPFTDAGFVVFAPSYRGENGNSGSFELFMGEVEDAKAAIRWIASQPYVDANQVYVFGWSVGGGIAMNLSLHDDINIRLIGSSAGVYDKGLIKSWATEDDFIKFPYDYTNEQENYFRLPLYHLEDMQTRQFTYIGEQDDYSFYRALYDSMYSKTKTRLTIQSVVGDHVSSLPVAIFSFLNEIKKDQRDNEK